MVHIFDSSPDETLFEKTRRLAICTASSGKGSAREELGTVLRSSAAIAALAGVALLSGDGNNAVQAADDTSVLKQVASVDLPGPRENASTISSSIMTTDGCFRRIWRQTRPT
jgi:hypothetical protein